MKDYEYEDGGGAYVNIRECSECGATSFQESRISGVCVPCLSGDVDVELEPRAWSNDLVGVV